MDDVAEHDPAVLIDDVSIPDDRSWRFFEHIRSHSSMKGRRWVLTSTNPARVHDIATDSNGVLIHEIIGKPYDLTEILEAVKREAAAR